jgi:hypothetical protein
MPMGHKIREEMRLGMQCTGVKAAQGWLMNRASDLATSASTPFMLMDLLRHGFGKLHSVRILPEFVPGGTL